MADDKVNRKYVIDNVDYSRCYSSLIDYIYRIGASELCGESPDAKRIRKWIMKKSKLVEGSTVVDGLYTLAFVFDREFTVEIREYDKLNKQERLSRLNSTNEALQCIIDELDSGVLFGKGMSGKGISAYGLMDSSAFFYNPRISSELREYAIKKNKKFFYDETLADLLIKLQVRAENCIDNVDFRMFDKVKDENKIVSKQAKSLAHRLYREYRVIYGTEGVISSCLNLAYKDSGVTIPKVRIWIASEKRLFEQEERNKTNPN